MATKTFTDLAMREAGHRKGSVRTIIDRMITARERQVRRYMAQNYALTGHNEFNNEGRQSLFEGRAPERN